MFSRTERNFLQLVARCNGLGGEGRAALVAAFPNPVYRRKLLWGIRRKALDAAADLQLYAYAAKVESKVLPAPSADTTVPLVADPLVTLTRGLQGLLRPGRGRTLPTTEKVAERDQESRDR